MNIDDLAKWAALIATILLSLATYRNSVRKADFDNLKTDLARERDKSNRLSDENAAFREDIETNRRDIISLGEHYSGMSKDVGTLVLLVNKLYTDYKKDTGKNPDIDWTVLDRALTIQHKTTPLGPLQIKNDQ